MWHNNVDLLPYHDLERSRPRDAPSGMNRHPTSLACAGSVVSNREDARRGTVRKLITDEVVRALKSHDELTLPPELGSAQVMHRVLLQRSTELRRRDHAGHLRCGAARP